MADPHVHTVSAQPLTSAAWEPYGQVVGRDECAIELRQGAEFQLDVLTYAWRPLRCESLNRHHTATQALIPLGGAPALVVVAPADATFTDEADIDRIEAFIISGAVGINLAIATWHWGPYPLGPEVHLVNVQARDVVHDNEVAHLERDLGTVIEIRL